MKPLFIIGYMGCGKTTFGTSLAKATGLQFIDLDDLIEKSQEASITQIFARYGEEGFRKIEREALIAIFSLKDTIIACGGGTPCFFNNIELMNSHGVTLWLNTTHECLFRRLKEQNAQRPLLAGKSDDEIRDTIISQLASRSPYYRRAHLSWPGDLLEDSRQIKTTIDAFLAAYPQFTHRIH